jgi:hypothetical protein
MIRLDFYSAVGLYIFLFLGIILIIWLISRRDKEQDLNLDSRFLWFCSVCTYTYVNTKEEKISACPRCGSYNKKD